MLNALLEIGCEEIPARFMPDFLADLKNKAVEKLQQERVSFSDVKTLGTYRRLTLIIEDLTKKQADLSEEVKGPPADRAFDPSGRPTQAALGFAASQKVSVDDLIVKTVGGKNYVFANIVKKGKSTEKVLAEIFPAIINSLCQPLAMRWGDVDFKFIRPIHWIVALCGAKVVKFKLAGITSGNKTSSHRFGNNVGTGLVPVRTNGQPRGLSLRSYKKFLLKLGVIVDQEERKGKIRQMVEAAAQKIGASALIEVDLLDEVTYLVENPIVYVGKLNAEFLKIPQDVLITSMKKNQKYFPLIDQSGKLQAKFVVVTDGCKNKGVVEGNQKVISARLADAKFFFEDDIKLPLKGRLAELERIAFFEKLGTMADKVNRVIKLAEWIGKRLKCDEASLKTIKRIAQLSKADLTTKMVYEFPVLQGIMGREYALLSGEGPKVARGIAEHYLPRFAGDKLPQSIEGIVVALADRLDTLVGCFSIGAIPTGSVDPYGLRRAVNGIIRIILDKKIDLLLDELIEHGGGAVTVQRQLLAFIGGRLKPILLEKGIRYDIVEAALANFNDILDAVEKAEALTQAGRQKWFAGVVQSAERVARISKDVPCEEVVASDLVEKEEKELFDLYMKVNWEVGEAINKEEWARAVQSLVKLTDPLESFFDKVLVMHKDERIKLNRLALLKSLERMYFRVADFSKVVLPG